MQKTHSFLRVLPPFYSEHVLEGGDPFFPRFGLPFSKMTHKLTVVQPGKTLGCDSCRILCWEENKANLAFLMCLGTTTDSGNNKYLSSAYLELNFM